MKIKLTSDGIKLFNAQYPQPAHSNLFHDICGCSDCIELNKKINHKYINKAIKQQASNIPEGFQEAYLNDSL